MKKYLFFCAIALLYTSCKHTSNAVKYPDMVADIDPFQIGSTSVSFDRTFSTNLKSERVEVFFYPRENEVALEVTNSTYRLSLFWNKDARRLFIEALNRYEEDFAEKRLITNYNKTGAIYGKTKIRFQWKTLKVSPTYRASPYIEIGYRFREDAPFFMLRQKAAREESGVNEGIKESPQYALYFTRAQARELAALFDNAFLLESIGDKELPPPMKNDRDEYSPAPAGNTQAQPAGNTQTQPAGNTQAQPEGSTQTQTPANNDKPEIIPAPDGDTPPPPPVDNNGDL